MPGLVTQVMRTEREIPNDKITLAQLNGIIKRYSKEDEDAVNCLPAMGSKPKFMVVSDCPSHSEESAKQFAAGRSFDYIQESLRQNKMKKGDAYWTGLLKRPKDNRQITAKEIKTYGPYLLEELELLKPQLILTLGSNSTRFFIPEMKSVMDQIGSTHYLPKLDATVIVGFNPAMIYHDANRQDDLNAIFEEIKGIISPPL